MDLVLVASDHWNTPALHFPLKRAVVVAVVNVFFKLSLSHCVDNVIIVWEPPQCRPNQVLGRFAVEDDTLDLDSGVTDVSIPQSHIHLALWEIVGCLEVSSPGACSESSKGSIEIVIDTIEWRSISNPS